MSLIGSVDFFDVRKGWGFIKVLTQDVEQSNQGVFFHRQNITVKDGCYKCVFPGEYVSFSLGKNDKGDMCIDITGIMGGPLLTEHPQWHYTKKAKYSRNHASHTEEAEAEAETEAEETEDT